VSEFHFRTKLDLPLVLGIRASNLHELSEAIKQVPDSSIYYHTHRYLEQHHFLSPEPPNDFAYWVSEIISDAKLAEQLWSIDIVQFRSIAELRGRLLDVIGSHVRSVERDVDCPEGEEFHFMASQMFVLPTQYKASTLGEFRQALERVSVGSLYYHIFDAKLRLQQDENDFSKWFREIGRPELADDVRNLDPYAYTLEGLRKRILVSVRKYDSH
jgi:hypothetical protein